MSASILASSVGGVMLGLLGNALLGLWWLDPAAALVISAVAVREGRESWPGDGCCVTSILPEESCREDCCA